MLIAAFRGASVAEYDLKHGAFPLRVHASDPGRFSVRGDHAIADPKFAHGSPAGRGQDVRIERLSFTQPHVVREAAADAEAVEEGEPLQAAELVGAEGAVEILRLRNVGGAEAA